MRIKMDVLLAIIGVVGMALLLYFNVYADLKTGIPLFTLCFTLICILFSHNKSIVFGNFLLMAVASSTLLGLSYEEICTNEVLTDIGIKYLMSITLTLIFGYVPMYMAIHFRNKESS